MRNRRVLALAVLVFASMLRTGSADASTTHAGRFVYVRQTTTTDAQASLLRTADCPDATRAVGAGGAISGSPTHQWLNRMEPMDALFGGDGIPDDYALAAGWSADNVEASITSVAICMAGKLSSSLDYASAARTFPPSSTFNDVNATCSGNVIGGGAGSSADPDVNLVWTAPGGSEWQARVSPTPSGSGATLSATAVCLPSGLKKVAKPHSRGVTVVPGEIRTIKVHCPPEFHVTSGGVGGGSLDGRGIDILKSLPFDGPDPDHAPDDGWVVTFYNQLETSWFVSTVAHCLR